ncbi:Piso0_001663 [Millerozyma farinosa CBS 7064]|uniref:DNA topoisomerase n=1 Tax=Pichia sorbitophila (strain ATCC MYA-4447 / BCRC 22081 / CBS 7064 / NBRC 10061 / NRRL Y-12695) TaxID=559304 RepID=G8YNR8_PICSO|nr:Piso0_001663 [Millerozyma farinosa CBS 7064]
MKILCVAEKPSISKAVSHILSGGKTKVRNSRNKYVKNYDFKFDFPGVGLCDVTMTSVMGHITNIDFPTQFSWGRCNPGRLFDAPTIDNVSNKEVYENISNEARRCNRLMIWTDCDREGEFIGHEIFSAAVKGNPSLRVEDIWRSQFSHLERSHILQAARNPIRLDMNSVHAVRCRMEIDLRVGASFTRFLTDLYRRTQVFPLEKGGFISYGTCQFPTLGFVVDRYNRVKRFIPEKFWYISITVKKDNKTETFHWTKNHVFDRLYLALIYQNCLKNDNAEVVQLIERPTSKYRPLPLTTVELQKNCSMYFKMSAKRALDAAEKLYNKGFLSYPRTETDRFPPTMDLKAVIQKQTQNSTWGQYASELLNGKFRSPRAGSHDDKAHPPIHPVNFVKLEMLDNADEKKVYELVVRRFLACCSEDAKGKETKISLRWGAEEFTNSAIVVLERNFLDVYPYMTWKSTTPLPPLLKGETIKVASSVMKEGKTSPPQHMTESELIALMDANGIGTDATIAEHIDKIISRGYVVKVRKNKNDFIIPSELGMGLIEGFNDLEFDNLSLSKPFLRKRLENCLQEIVSGTKVKEQVVQEIIFLYKQAFGLSAQNSTKLIAACRRIMDANSST